MAEEDFVYYSRITMVEMRPYVAGEDMTNIYVDVVYADKGHPKEGDMIARNPKDRDELWLITGESFAVDFESLAESRGAPKSQAKPAGTRAQTKQEF
jgi:hypothetical protein